MLDAITEVKGERPLSAAQIQTLIENLAWEPGLPQEDGQPSPDRIHYENFLKSFCVVDTGRMSECASTGWHLLQAAFSPAMHSLNRERSSSVGTVGSAGEGRFWRPSPTSPSINLARGSLL